MTEGLDEDYKAYFARVVDNWLKLELWTLMEAVWLSFGLNPYDVTSGEENLPLEDIVGDNDVRTLRAQIETALEAGKLKGKNGKVAPRDFVAWARKNPAFITLPPALLDKADSKMVGEAEEAPMRAREENNLYRIIAALAVTQHKLNPLQEGWMSQLRPIVKDLQKKGLAIKDEETILKQLKKAILEYPLQPSQPN